MILYYIGWYVCVPYFSLSLFHYIYFRLTGLSGAEATETIERIYYWKGK